MANTAENIDIAAWCRDVIEGVGGMDSYEEHEVVTWHDPERVAAARWVVRCLANPRCEGSREVLDAILARRAEDERAAVNAD